MKGSTIFLPTLECKHCHKEIDRDDTYLPEGDLVSYSHPSCYVEAWRHERGENCGNVLCVRCGSPLDTSIDVVRLAR